jgi:hypothetical protein
MGVVRARMSSLREPRSIPIGANFRALRHPKSRALVHLERDVAFEDAAGRYYLNCSAGRCLWHLSLYKRSGFHHKAGRDTVESDAGSTRQTSAQYLDLRTRLARRGSCLHKRPQTERKAKDRCALHCSIEVAIGVLNEARVDQHFSILSRS